MSYLCVDSRRLVSVLEMLTRARVVKSVQLVNGLAPDQIVRAVRGERVGTVISAG